MTDCFTKQQTETSGLRVQKYHQAVAKCKRNDKVFESSMNDSKLSLGTFINDTMLTQKQGQVGRARVVCKQTTTMIYVPRTCTPQHKALLWLFSAFSLFYFNLISFLLTTLFHSDVYVKAQALSTPNKLEISNEQTAIAVITL